MIGRLTRLRRHPAVFRHLTGLTPALFGALAADVLPAFAAADRARKDRPGRHRAVGGGDTFDLDPADQLLLAVVWLRHYPTQEVLGYLFGVSDSTALRAARRCLPLLEQAGRDTMRVPDPGKYRRKKLPALLRDTPGLAVIVDTFEQRVQRPGRRRVVVEHAIGRLRRFQALSQVDRHRRRGHAARVRAVAGLVNRLLDERPAA